MDKGPDFQETANGNPEPEEQYCNSDDCCKGVSRRQFVQLAGLGGVVSALPTTISPKEYSEAEAQPGPSTDSDPSWPTLKRYDADHLARVALPLGGIGTGTVSLMGNGSLRDWEIVNRPSKGFTPQTAESGPFFCLYTSDGKAKTCRVLEGPMAADDFEGSHGSTDPSARLPRFRNCTFDSAYPFGRVTLTDDEVPVTAAIKAFNPLIPGDANSSGIPVAILTFEVSNPGLKVLDVSVCGNIPNFVGIDGWEQNRDWKGDSHPVGAKQNRNQFRTSDSVRGIFMDSQGVGPRAQQWGTLCLATLSGRAVSYRTSWEQVQWGRSILDFWDDFSADGKLDLREPWGTDIPMASLAVQETLPPGGRAEITFLLSWHFPNRYSWTPKTARLSDKDWIGNYYCTRYSDAWDVARKVGPRIPQLKARTTDAVVSICQSDMHEVVKEAALFNLTGLRSQTSFRIEDGSFFGFEGCADNKGCCHGSCTHVWNYEQATAFLFGELAQSMRKTEFNLATNEQGLMSFRVDLPVSRAQDFGKAAADGQLGCILKLHRDWQLSGDGNFLRRLWPKARKALEFCWIAGGWDADQDGVMEGCQHNTMDVEYFGPNPQMQFWYLGALKAAGEMAEHVGESAFGKRCRDLFSYGSDWIDANLFDGEYYQHEVRPISDQSKIAPSLLIGMGSRDFGRPDYQLASGCLVDQLVGQFMAHICDLGYLASEENIKTTLRSILKYNGRNNLDAHFNSLRTFATDGESALLMASYPKGRPSNPFPYFSEVMTGFEYTAAVGMLYEGMEDEGLTCIQNVRDRYDGLRRSPFDEAECGHHYARAMASWAAILALTGFHYSGVKKRLGFQGKDGTNFWSNGYAWGNCQISVGSQTASVNLTVKGGSLELEEFVLANVGRIKWDTLHTLEPGQTLGFEVRKDQRS
jgi:uncharacterized protein (DUF608 family)